MSLRFMMLAILFVAFAFNASAELSIRCNGYSLTHHADGMKRLGDEKYMKVMEHSLSPAELPNGEFVMGQDLGVTVHVKTYYNFNEPTFENRTEVGLYVTELCLTTEKGGESCSTYEAHIRTSDTDTVYVSCFSEGSI